MSRLRSLSQGSIAAAAFAGAIALLFVSPGAEAQAPHFSITTIGQDVGAEAGPQALALADVNRDGRDDLIAINRHDDSTKVLVRLAQEDGTFGEATELDVLIDGDPEIPTAVAVGDIGSGFLSPNEGAADGNPDIVVATEFGAAVIFVGAGDGTFEIREEPDLDGIEVGVTLADLDGDSNLDIIGIDGDFVVAYFNRGTFFDVDAPIDLDPENSGNAVDVATGDFDGDGAIDIIVLNQDDQTVALFVATSPGVFDELADPILRSTIASEVEALPTDFAVADFEDDGIDNVVVITFGTFADDLATIMSGARLGIITSRPAPFGGSGLALANFDGDSQGIIDAVFVSEDERAVFQVGDGTASAFPDVGGEPISLSNQIVIAAGDINDDGRPDFVSLDVGGTELNVAINVGFITPEPTASPSRTPTATMPTQTRTSTPIATPTGASTLTAAPTSTGLPTSTPVATSTSPTSTPATPSIIINIDNGCAVTTTKGRSIPFPAWLLVMALALRRRQRRC